MRSPRGNHPEVGKFSRLIHKIGEKNISLFLVLCSYQHFYIRFHQVEFENFIFKFPAILACFWRRPQFSLLPGMDGIPTSNIPIPVIFLIPTFDFWLPKRREKVRSFGGWTNCIFITWDASAQLFDKQLSLSTLHGSHEKKKCDTFLCNHCILANTVYPRTIWFHTNSSDSCDLVLIAKSELVPQTSRRVRLRKTTAAAVLPNFVLYHLCWSFPRTFQKQSSADFLEKLRVDSSWTYLQISQTDSNWFVDWNHPLT